MQDEKEHRGDGERLQGAAAQPLPRVREIAGKQPRQPRSPGDESAARFRPLAEQRHRCAGRQRLFANAPPLESQSVAGDPVVLPDRSVVVGDELADHRQDAEDAERFERRRREVPLSARAIDLVLRRGGELIEHREPQHLDRSAQRLDGAGRHRKPRVVALALCAALDVVLVHDARPAGEWGFQGLVERANGTGRRLETAVFHRLHVHRAADRRPVAAAGEQADERADEDRGEGAAEQPDDEGRQRLAGPLPGDVGVARHERHPDDEGDQAAPLEQSSHRSGA